MRLIYCPKCGDLLLLVTKRRDCGCGASWGWHEDDEGIYCGEAEPITINHQSLRSAIQDRDLLGSIQSFKAFVPQNWSILFKKV